MKEILAIHRDGKTLVDQEVLQKYCKHEHTIVHYMKGIESADADYEIICLDCGRRIDQPTNDKGVE